MPEPKPIPTKYNGVQSRSRLEARWALFFDQLGIDYRYEFEGFQLRSGWYLPDFYLPQFDVFIEHWGLDQDWQVPEWFDQSTLEYMDKMEKKKKWLHTKINHLLKFFPTSIILTNQKNLENC